MNPIEKDPRAVAAMRRWDELKAHRDFHEPDWQDIARLIRPQRGHFGDDRRDPRKLDKPLSSEPIMAQSSYAAGIYAGLTNPANRWGGLETPDKDLNNWKPMAEWLDIATKRVMNSFAPSVSSFYSSSMSIYSDIAAFGNGAGYDQVDEKRRGFIDVSVSLAEVVVDIDAHNRVVEAVRKYFLTPIQAVMEFGKDALPPKLLEKAEKGGTDKIAFFYHVVPNTEFAPGGLGPRGKAYLAHTVCEMEATLVRVGGFEEMPFYMPRWDVDSGMVYGTGPGFISLASARMLNQMDAATIRAAQFAADPTKLAPDRNAMPMNGTIRPGSVVYGAIGMQGQQLLQNMQANTQIGLTIEEKRAKIEAIKDVFHYSIMSLTGRTGVTSEESQIMEEARLRNWAPNADRVMEEYAARKFERRFKMLFRLGQIPPPPDEAAGQPLKVRYQSQAAMAMKAREGMQIRQFINDLGPLAQMKPRVADRLSEDDLVEAMHDASPSLPASILRSREEADALQQQRQEQQAQQEQLAAAAQGGSIAKDFAQAASQAGLVE